MDPSIKKLMENLLEMQETLLSELKDLKSFLTNTLEELNNRIKSMDYIIQNYKYQTDTISQKINFLKNQYKRKNIINLKEEIQESRKELEEKTISLFSNTMKISIDLSQIDIVRRIGSTKKY